MKTTSLLLIFFVLLSGCDLLSPEKGDGGGSIDPPIDPPAPSVKPTLHIKDSNHVSTFLWDTKSPVDVAVEAKHASGVESVSLWALHSSGERFITVFAPSGINNLYEASFVPTLTGTYKIEARATSKVGTEAKVSLPFMVTDDQLYYGANGRKLYRFTESGQFSEMFQFDSNIESYEALDADELWFQVDTKDRLWKIYYDGTEASSVEFDGTAARVYEGDTLVYEKAGTNDFHGQIYWGIPGDWEVQLTSNQCQDIQGETCVRAGTDPVIYRGEIIVNKRGRKLNSPVGGHPVGKLDPSTGEIETLFFNPNPGQACSPRSSQDEHGLIGLSCSGLGSDNGYAAIYNFNTESFVQFPDGTQSPAFLETPEQVLLTENGGRISVWDVSSTTKLRDFPTIASGVFGPQLAKK